MVIPECGNKKLMNEKIMKRLIKINILFYLLAGLIFTSCKKWEDDTPVKTNSSDGIPVSFKIGTLSLPENLQCDLYIFYKEGANDPYILKDTKTLANGIQNRIKFMNHELKDKYYRFLFIATPVSAKEIDVLTVDNAALQNGEEWENIMIKLISNSISTDNYFDILDKEGNDILNEGNISGELTRLVGQVVFDFFRINSDMNSPIDIISQKVSSVMDRVFQIDIEYSNLTVGLTFDNDKNINNEIKSINHSITQYSYPVNNNFRVTIPQSGEYLENTPYNLKGSTRIMGLCGLPSSSNVNIKLTFHYFDSTPFCGNSDGGAHTESCYEKKNIVLNLPRNSSSLLVKSNNYTVNKAGLNYDRIIDMGVGTSIQLQTDWELN